MLCRPITYLEPGLEYEQSHEKRMKISKQNDPTESKPGRVSSKFENLCLDIFIEIFRYLRPIDLIYSLDNLLPHLDDTIEQHTRSMDFRLINKNFFNKFIETLPIHSIVHIEKMCLSNNFTCGEISEMFDKFPWSSLTRLQSLKLEFIGSFEFSKYVKLISSVLPNLRSLSVDFDPSDSAPDSSLTQKILRIDYQQAEIRLTACYITGFPCTFPSYCDLRSNEILRTLKISLQTLDDLFVIYRLFPRLESLSCDIFDHTSKSVIDLTVSSTCLTDLTLIIEKSITLKLMEKILSPHQQLRSLIFKALLIDETTSRDLPIEVNGLELEKIFRQFSNLKTLKFYLRYIQNANMWDRCYKPNHFYLFPFTCRYWSDRSIQIMTHTLTDNRERYIYTIPFAFHTFEIDGQINSILNENLTFAYEKVHHLIISSAIPFDQYIYSTVMKNFPNLKKLTLVKRPSSMTSLDFLSNHRWICEKKVAIYPLIYTRLEVPSMHKLTIYEMSDSKWNEMRPYFASVQILVVHVENLSTFLLTRHVYIDLIFQMKSLFSLTVHHPESNLTDSMRTVLLEKLLSSKKYFFIKCDRGILRVWF